MKGWIGVRQARWLSMLVLSAGLALAAAHAAPPPEPGLTPDPATVQRWGAGWRYPQAGWTVIHIEGAPRERGLQHGHLMATEIAAYIRALSEFWGPQAPAAAWAQNRAVARRLFEKGFPTEQVQEMQGIAEGANAAGARAHGRPLDVLDIITLNTSNEIDTVHDALLVTQGAPDIRVATQQPLDPSLRVVRPRKKPPQRCNAFIANGPATADGQIVFGHITMYDLYPANFYNVWMEVNPTTGHRFVMQTTPGGMHSGMDYSINEAGMLLAETTLDQGPMIAGGTPLAARIRQAQQYAGSIDEAAALLTKNDNGLCSTEWVMGDLKRNEIALLTLAGGQSKLHRSSKAEWFEDAEGFYWSDNNIKEPGARLAASARRDARPSASAAYVPSKRDAVWLREYRAHKGLGLRRRRQVHRRAPGRPAAQLGLVWPAHRRAVAADRQGGARSRGDPPADPEPVDAAHRAGAVRYADDPAGRSAASPPGLAIAQAKRVYAARAVLAGHAAAGQRCRHLAVDRLRAF